MDLILPCIVSSISSFYLPTISKLNYHFLAKHTQVPKKNIKFKLNWLLLKLFFFK